jgi:hypothetical protein
MMEKPSNRILKVTDEHPSGSPWVTRYLQEELEKGLNDPARTSKWFRDRRGWIERATRRDKEVTAYLNARVPQHLFRALKKYTADHDLTIRAFIVDALEKALKDRDALKEFSLN